jgi:hypothetical protein
MSAEGMVIDGVGGIFITLEDGAVSFTLCLQNVLLTAEEFASLEAADLEFCSAVIVLNVSEADSSETEGNDTGNLIECDLPGLPALTFFFEDDMVCNESEATTTLAASSESYSSVSSESVESSVSASSVSESSASSASVSSASVSSESASSASIASVDSSAAGGGGGGSSSGEAVPQTVASVPAPANGGGGGSDSSAAAPRPAPRRPAPAPRVVRSAPAPAPRPRTRRNRKKKASSDSGDDAKAFFEDKDNKGLFGESESDKKEGDGAYTLTLSVSDESMRNVWLLVIGFGIMNVAICWCLKRKKVNVTVGGTEGTRKGNDFVSDEEEI